MDEQSKTSTKDKILKTAAKMFSESGYDKVSTREIANAIGINSATLYYYFTSKDDILKSLYKFYSAQRSKEAPDINELLRLVETEPPHRVLMRTEFHYNEEYREILDQILAIAVREINADPESERFIQENTFDSINNTLKPLIERMMELGKIEPIDTDVFLRVLAYYCFSAAALNKSAFGQSIIEYHKGMSLVFSTIIPVEI